MIKIQVSRCPINLRKTGDRLRFHGNPITLKKPYYFKKTGSIDTGFNILNYFEKTKKCRYASISLIDLKLLDGIDIGFKVTHQF